MHTTHTHTHTFGDPTTHAMSYAYHQCAVFGVIRNTRGGRSQLDRARESDDNDDVQQSGIPWYGYPGIWVRVCIVTRVWATDNDTVTVPKLIFIYDTVTNTDHVRSSPRVSRGDEHDPFD